MRQFYDNLKLITVDLTELKTVSGIFSVHARPRPRSADRARRRAHRAEPAVLLSWRVATRASGLEERKAEDPEANQAHESQVQSRGARAASPSLG